MQQVLATFLLGAYSLSRNFWKACVNIIIVQYSRDAMYIYESKHIKRFVSSITQLGLNESRSKCLVFIWLNKVEWRRDWSLVEAFSISIVIHFVFGSSKHLVRYNIYCARYNKTITPWNLQKRQPILRLNTNAAKCINYVSIHYVNNPQHLIKR